MLRRYYVPNILKDSACLKNIKNKFYCQIIQKQVEYQNKKIPIS